MTKGETGRKIERREERKNREKEGTGGERKEERKRKGERR